MRVKGNILLALLALSCGLKLSAARVSLHTSLQEAKKAWSLQAKPALLLAEDKPRAQRQIAPSPPGKVVDKTVIDFEAVDITGAQRTPMGSVINQGQPAKDYDFVKVRTNWHPEMMQSVISLDTHDAD